MSVIDKQAMSLPIMLYIVGWVFFVYLFVQLFNYGLAEQNNLLVSGLAFINFGIHEVSHLVVFFLPTLIVAAAGSFGEIAFPALVMALAIRAKSYFAAIFAALWTMLAMHSVGRYMADARAQALPLMGPGESIQHDWNYIFSQLGTLQYDTLIGGSVRTAGTVLGISALILGLYLIVIKLLVRSTVESADHQGQ